MARTSAGQLAFNFDPPKPVFTPKPYEPPPRREVMTRAYGVVEPMLIGFDERDPIEIEVRRIPTLVRFSSFFQTYAVQPAGSAYWSETGFKSFAGFQGRIEGGLTPSVLTEIISTDIDSKWGGNGKLTKWWPSYCLQWRQNKAFADKMDRSTTWDQWGPEKQAEHWAEFDTRQAEALARMAAEGIDPEEVWRTR